MTAESVLVNILIYVAIPVIALVLLVCWLVYASRGGRAVKIAFKGFGVSIDVDSSAGPAPLAGPGPKGV